MAWDTEGTKRRLLDAGARQFAAHGFAGATMDAIGRDAGINKERVYQYFGDKRGFFAAVLADRLDGLLDGAEIDGIGPGAIGRYAAELFDRYERSPELARLLAWESLELAEPASAAGRAAACAARATSIRIALPGIDQTRAEHLLLTIVTLVTGWHTLSRLGEVILAEPSSIPRRSQLITQVEQLTRHFAV